MSVGNGLQQALDYGKILDIPFVYSSNGEGFVEHDGTGMSSAVERHLALDAFPSPDDLWERYQRWKHLETAAQTAIAQDYHYERNGKTPRYYQRIAINRTTEAIIDGRKRILLVMATGTGKTYTAFQIVWRLWRSRQAKRILYLADRNVLIDQTMVNDFRHFGDKMTKVTNHTADKSYEIYMALYQGLSGAEEHQNIYRQFSPDFFDLIIVDECHRGSADEASAWRQILEYFEGATQIGLTATPKETEDVSNIGYFGDPVYTPVVIRDPSPDYRAGDDGGSDLPPGGGEEVDPIRKYYVDGVEVQILTERVQYRAADGHLVSESFEAFSRANLLKAYGSLDDFLRKWNAAERKEAILAELLDQGVLLDELAETVGLEMDPFDLICHVAFDQPPLTRRERAENVVKRNYFGQYGDTARLVLEGLLAKYTDDGIDPVEDAIDNKTSIALLHLAPFNQIGTPMEIARAFGGREQYLRAIQDLEREIYRAA